MPIPDKMIFEMLNNVNSVIKVKKEIDKVIKAETNICQHNEESFNSDTVNRLSIQNLYNFDSENLNMNEEMEYL